MNQQQQWQQQRVQHMWLGLTEQHVVLQSMALQCIAVRQCPCCSDLMISTAIT
jgi:hypothetical protein